MNSLKLKETINQIQIGECMQKEIIWNVENQVKSRQKKISRMKKAAVTAAVFALVVGAAIPIRAGIRYLVSDRMENIPDQELAQVRQMIQEQEDVEADSFTREYSKEERTRMQQLEEAYQDGKFPQQTITQTDSSNIQNDSLSYMSDKGTFHLPDRTLTDEELLQIIDFNYTRDYALAQGDEAKKARKQRDLEVRRLKKEVKDADGLTEQEAEQAAAQFLKTEFGVSAKEAEVDIFLDQQMYDVAAYHVGFHIQDEGTIYAYGIDLSADDGKLLGTSSASLPKR